MSLWTMLTGLWQRDNAQLIAVWIDPSHTDRPSDGVAMAAGQHYFRLRLAEMFLQYKVQAMKSWYPAVHSMVGFDFGNKRVDIPNVADASRIGSRESGRGDVVARNFMLTPAMPFNGGTVDLDAGLIAIQGQNYLNNFIQVLGGFATLLNVPQLSTVLNLAGPLADGLQELVGAGNGQRHLGFHDSYAAGDLKSGYIAVIRQTEDQVDTQRLWVAQDQLREGDGVGAGQSAPFDRCDFMLFRFEVFAERDDWDGLTSISTSYQDAITALGDGDEKKADFHMQRARVAAHRAPELTTADRRRVVEQLNVRYVAAKQDLGMSGLVGPNGQASLAAAMRGAMSVELALEQGEPTLSEALNVP